MSPYVFRHYDGSNDPKTPRKYDFTYDYDYRKPKKKESHHHHHHHYYISPREDRRRVNHSEDHLIHYLPPARSLPPMYIPDSAKKYYRDEGSEVRILKARSETMYPPRMVVEKRRRHWDMESNICLDTCPRKSSKRIPSMFYDQLRCPHCMAHVQPSQGEVQAYPWTLVNYHPRRSGPISEPGLDIRSQDPNIDGSLAGANQATKAPSDFSVQRLQGKTGSIPNGPVMKAPSLANRSVRQEPSMANGPNRKETNAGDDTRRLPTVSRHEPTVARRNSKTQDPNNPQQEDAGDGAGSMPPERERSRPMFGTGEKARNPRGTYVSMEQGKLLPTREFDEDDVLPNDSISNVGLPPLRATTDLSLQGGYKPPHRKKPASDIDYNLPKDRYFQSIREQHPGYAPSTPKPHMKPREHRVYEGQYYDRLNGQTYKYNIDMGKRSVVSERRPNG